MKSKEFYVHQRFRVDKSGAVVLVASETDDKPFQRAARGPRRGQILAPQRHRIRSLDALVF